MKLTIKTKNLQLTPLLENFINKKMDKIEKFLPDNQDLFLEIEIEKESLHHRKGEVYAAEAIIELPGKKLVAKAKEEDLQKAITEVEKELEI